MMTATAMIQHKAHAHGPAVSSWVAVSPSREVQVHTCYADGHQDAEPFGQISEPGVWEAACEATGVFASRLTVVGSTLVLAITFHDGDGGVESDEIYLCRLDSAGAWRFVPHSHFDDFGRICDETED